MKTDEAHYNVRFRLGEIRGLWSECSDQQRLEIIKSVIWTAPDMHSFHQKVRNLINSDQFLGTLD